MQFHPLFLRYQGGTHRKWANQGIIPLAAWAAAVSKEAKVHFQSWEVPCLRSSSQMMLSRVGVQIFQQIHPYLMFNQHLCFELPHSLIIMMAGSWEDTHGGACSWKLSWQLSIWSISIPQSTQGHLSLKNALFNVCICKYQSIKCKQTTAAPDDNCTSSAELYRNTEWEPKQLQEHLLLGMLPSKRNLGNPRDVPWNKWQENPG